MDEKGNLSLLELQEMVCEAVSGSFPDALWVRAEISEVKRNRNGHCYLALVEKEESSATVVAKASAIIWASSLRVLDPFFESAAGAPLDAGMNVLVKVRVQYSELYGLSLVICDIDPSYTVGELEAQRRRTILRLQQEGMFDMNSSLRLPALPRRFAVVSSETAAGYRDFMRQLHENEGGYSFETELYPAQMQGAECPASIIAAMDRVIASGKEYDALLILRGGGGAMDLSCFDDYDLAVNVAQFPLPVLTGIGHDHDYHVADMVAHTFVKTPTALADHIVGLFEEADGSVALLAQRLHLAVTSRLASDEARVDRMVLRMRSAVSLKVLDERHRIERLELRIRAASPSDILDKGFALVLKDGRKTISSASLAKGDRVKILLSDGTVDAEIL